MTQRRVALMVNGGAVAIRSGRDDGRLSDPDTRCSLRAKETLVEWPARIADEPCCADRVRDQPIMTARTSESMWGRNCSKFSANMSTSLAAAVS